MAGASRDLRIDITGDESDLGKAYDRASKKTKEFDDEVDKSNKKTEDRFKKVADVVVDGVTSVIGTISSLVSKAGPANIALIAGALIALGPAAELGAAGITLGLGTALITLGVTAAAQSAAVKGEFMRLAADVKSDMQDFAKPLEASLFHAADVGRDVFGSFAPELSKSFASLSPHVDAFLKNMGGGLKELVPSIEPVTNAMNTLLDALGQNAPEIFKNLGDGITTLANTTAEHADDIAAAINIASKAFSLAASLGELIAKTWDTEMSKLEDTISVVSGGHWIPDLDNSNAAFKRAADTAVIAAQNIGKLTEKFDGAAVSADELKKSLDILTGVHISADLAAINLRKTIDDATESIKKNGQGIDINTEKGRNNKTTLIDIAKASADVLIARADEGATVRDLNGLYTVHRDQLIKVAEKMGLSASEAKKLADRYLALPKNINTDIKANASEAQSTIDNFITLNSGRQIPINVYAKNSQLADGGLIGFAEGGKVNGPGGSRTDSVPIRVSRGEYVVNAAATRRYLPLLDQINHGKPVTATGGGGTSRVYNINTTVGPTANAAAVGAEIISTIQAFENTNGNSWRRNN